jgi:hypothetical protein
LERASVDLVPGGDPIVLAVLLRHPLVQPLQEGFAFGHNGFWPIKRRTIYLYKARVYGDGTGQK